MFRHALLLATAASSALAYVVNNGTTCYVFPESLTHGGQPVDDTPSILQAFDLCGINGSVVLTDNTFNIDQVMNTTNLPNCDVSLYGEMVWSTNIPYWLSHTYFVTYANLSTAWLFGGTNAILINSSNAAWIKTWQGQNALITGNGDTGGGGGGFVKNVTWRNIHCSNVDRPIYVTQCIYGGDPSVCDTSKVQISDITWQNITGTSRYDVAGSIHCSSAAPCPDLRFIDVNITSVNATLGLPNFNVATKGELFLCANIVNQNTTSGIPCNGFAPNDFPQQLTMNY